MNTDSNFLMSPSHCVCDQLFSQVQLFDPMDCRLLCWWNFPGKNTGVSGHFLLWAIFPTQVLNRCLLHWQMDSLPLCHLGANTLPYWVMGLHGICVLPSPISWAAVPQSLYGGITGSQAFQPGAGCSPFNRAACVEAAHCPGPLIPQSQPS